MAMTKSNVKQSNELIKNLKLNIEGAKLSFDKFGQTQIYLAKLLYEVDMAIANHQRPPIEWIISHVSGGSVHLTLEANPQHKIDEGVISAVLESLAIGMTTLSQVSERPRYFSDGALKNIRKLTKLDKPNDFMIALEVNSYLISLNQNLADNIDNIFEKQYTSFGTVEGILKAIDLSRKPIFKIYDILTNKNVCCYFNSHSIDMIKDALDKRVLVSGLVKSKEDGQKISIKVNEIEIFPSENQLPNIEEMIGIL